GGSRASLDARSLVAGLPGAATDLISRRISFRRHVDERSDVAADSDGRKRTIWRSVTELCAAADDRRCAAGDDLRRDWPRKDAIAGRSGSNGRGAVRDHGTF